MALLAIADKSQMQVQALASKDTTRPVLSTVLLEIETGPNGKTATLTATDNYALGQREIDAVFGLEHDIKLEIPGEAIKSAIKLMDQSARAFIYENKIEVKSVVSVETDAGTDGYHLIGTVPFVVQESLSYPDIEAAKVKSKPVDARVIRLNAKVLKMVVDQLKHRGDWAFVEVMVGEPDKAIVFKDKNEVCGDMEFYVMPLKD